MSCLLRFILIACCLAPCASGRATTWSICVPRWPRSSRMAARLTTPTGSDQSPYAHLHTADQLTRSNAGRVFRAMEFE